MIGSIKDLKDAARGKTVRSTLTPQQSPKPSNLTNQFNTAGTGYNIPYEQPDVTEGVMGQSYGSPTQTYAQMLAGSGSSGFGKYGGFNTEGALQSAIRGGAMNFATMVPSNLRSAAAQRYIDIEKAAAPATQRVTKDFFGGTVDSYRKFKDYRGQLGEWYKQNAAPAEEYVRTAQQIESTPVSSLASQIASRRYGQSPDWATDVFKDLDTEFSEYKRNQKYMADVGMTYDEYVNRLAERDRLRGVNNQAAMDMLETATGLRGNYVTGVTARSPEQLRAALEGDVQYRDPSQPYEKDTATAGKGAEAVDIAKTYINKRDYQNAYDLAQSLEDEGFPDTAYLIYAMLKVSGASADLKNRLALTGIVEP